MFEQLITRYHDRLSGVLSCYDRIVITKTIPGACYAAGMTTFLHLHHRRIFDYARFAEPLRNRIRKLAEEAGSNDPTRCQGPYPQGRSGCSRTERTG